MPYAAGSAFTSLAFRLGATTTPMGEVVMHPVAGASSHQEPPPAQHRRPELRIAGVAGGVGTSTWCRLVGLAWPQIPVKDLGVYAGGFEDAMGRFHRVSVDALVTSITAASTQRLLDMLRMCPRPPVVIVMHTVPGGVPPTSRAFLRAADPHLAAQLSVAHRVEWVQMVDAPGERVPMRNKNIAEVLRAFPEAIKRVGQTPVPPGVTGGPPRIQTSPVAAIRAGPGHRMTAGPGGPGSTVSCRST